MRDYLADLARENPVSEDEQKPAPRSVAAYFQSEVTSASTRACERTAQGRFYRRTIEGQSRWLPDNAIEIALEITENDVKRTETILLEGFEPKTLVLREDPAHGRRELLRLIPVSGPLEPDKSPSVPVEGLGKMESNPRETLGPEPGKFQLQSPVLIRDNQVLVNIAGSATATEKDPAASLYSPGLGRFIFSSVPFEGAIEGKLRFNQISFTLEGKSYLLLTGAPVSPSSSVWVVHQPFLAPFRFGAERVWRPTDGFNFEPSGSLGVEMRSQSEMPLAKIM